MLRIIFLFVIWFNVLPRYSAAQDFADTLPPLRSVASLSREIAFPPLSKPLQITEPFVIPPLPPPEYGKTCYKVKSRQFVAPTVFLVIGTTGVTVAKVKIWDDIIHSNFEKLRRRHYDDYLQYAPMAAPYLLKACGIRGRHSYGEYTILLATSYVSMGIIVNTLKHTVKRERPDGSSRTSFPSGHTATAFMGAELLRSEFWEVSPWIGISGYSLAVTIGFMRVYNDRHWTTDVLAGAGIGILSVRIAYWTFPAIQRLLFGKNGAGHTYVSAAPYYDGSRWGSSVNLCF